MRSFRVDNYIVDTPIAEIISELKLNLSNGKLKDIEEHSDNIVVTCPHHSGGHESKPAMNIYVGNDQSIEYGYARCFVCGFEGHFYQFVAECFECSEERAKQWLISNFGKLAYEKLDLGEDIVIGKNKMRSVRSMDKSILETYQNYCPYLAKRNLTKETCQKFNVKYDSKYRQVVFPCYDVNNNLIMMPKRSIDTKTFYLDKDVEKPVYCLNNIIKNNIKQAIVTEGPFDTLLANQYGFPAVGTLGTPSDEQIKEISKSGINILYAMFDNDAAGRKFTASLRAGLEHLNAGIIVIDVRIPSPYKDIGELDYDTFWKILKNYKN